MVIFEQSFFFFGGGEGKLQKMWRESKPGRFAHQRSFLLWCGAALNLLVGSCTITIEIYTNVLCIGWNHHLGPSLPIMFDCHHWIITPKTSLQEIDGHWACRFFFPDFQFMEGPNFGFCISHFFWRFEWACWFHAVQKVLVFGPISNGQQNPSCWGLASARISGSLINEPNRRRFWKRNLENC